MSRQRPDLSVIVVTHQGRELALATLKSALASTGPIDAEWLVVDSGSTDGTPEAVEAELGLPVTRRGNIGFAAANNVALPAARGRYVLLLNPDVIVERGTLADVVRTLDARPQVGAASVIQAAPDGSVMESIRAYPSPARQFGEALMAERLPFAHRLRESERDLGRYHSERSADWLVGAFLVVRREALRAVGPLDERFFLYSEEKDWCFRIRRAGWDVRHLPVMTVTHHTGRSARPDLVAQLSWSKLLFARKHLGPAGRAGIHAGLVLRHALRSAVFTPLALLRPSVRMRAEAERRALAVTIGLVPPAFAPVAAAEARAPGAVPA